MKSLLLRAVIFVVTTAVPPAASAAVFTVNSGKVDAVDAQIDGICATAGGVCTLRAAIQEANANPDHDDIILPLGKYALKLTGSDDAAAKGDLDVSSDVTILGAGPKTIIAGSKGDRVFTVLSGAC